VAGVWAVAATAVALIALLDTSDSDAKRTARGAADRNASLERRQQRLGKRLGALDARIGGLAPAVDVSNLEARLGRVEGAATAAKTAVEQARDELTDLGKRVGTLEDAPPSTGVETGSAEPNSSEPPR